MEAPPANLSPPMLFRFRTITVVAYLTQQGAALLQRAATQLNGVANSASYQPLPQPPADVSMNPTPTSTPVLSRRNKTNKSFMGVSVSRSVGMYATNTL